MTSFILLLGVTFLNGTVQEQPVPALSGRVVDDAALLESSTRSRIEEQLRTFEESTGAQIVVLTLSSLEGRTIEEVALEAGRSWELGRRDHDDGVLFLIAKDERKARIEVGRGLEGELPDARVGRILREDVIPFFRDGDFDTGVARGVTSLIAASRGEVPASSPSTDPTTPTTLDDLPLLGKIGLGLLLSIFLIGVSFASLFLIGGKLQFLFVGIFGSMCSLGIGAILGIPYLSWLVYLGAYLALLIFHRSTGWTPAVLSGLQRSSGSGRSWTDDYASSDYCSSSSSSSVSGGGGSFGGGGASEDW